MAHPREIVITGIGVVSPIGIGCAACWSALATGTSGIRAIDAFDSSGLRTPYGGQIATFDPKLYVRPRKSLKVMGRDIQLGVSAADLAMTDASLAAGTVEPERFGVVMGADMIYADIEDLELTYRRSVQAGRFDFGCWSEAIQEELHPLWLLKHLPNMTASHIAIAHDARGHNSSIVLGDVSSLLAIGEAASIIRRGRADVMLTGGTGCRLHPTALVARGEALLSRTVDDYRRVCRPFDRDRDGMLDGEGAAGDIRRVLEQEGVAAGEHRDGGADDLPEGKIPRHDREDHAQRLKHDARLGRGRHRGRSRLRPDLSGMQSRSPGKPVVGSHLHRVAICGCPHAAVGAHLTGGNCGRCQCEHRIHGGRREWSAHHRLRIRTQ